MELLETWIFLLYRIFLIISYFSYRILATEISAFRRHITSSGCRMRLDSHRLKPIWIGEKAGSFSETTEIARSATENSGGELTAVLKDGLGTIVI